MDKRWTCKTAVELADWAHAEPNRIKASRIMRAALKTEARYQQYRMELVRQYERGGRRGLLPPPSYKPPYTPPRVPRK